MKGMFVCVDLYTYILAVRACLIVTVDTIAIIAIAAME
jgi:hypothetical protein